MATYNQIGYGSQGSDVTELQKLLNSQGYTLDTDGIFGEKTQAAVKDYQQKNNLDVDGIVGENTWGALTKANTAGTGATAGTVDANNGFTYDPFKVSDSTLAADQKRQELESQKPGDFSYDAYEKSDIVKQAEAMLQQQLANKPGEYQSQWQAQLDDTLNKILNREKFSYDLNGDALYQQYKDQYMLQGQQAMMDTMGQAQAMTGGYANSYAQSVGQQTYQGYLQQLNDRVPELYQLALNQYNREGEDLYNQYGLYADRENLDYGRYRDQVSDYYTELDRLTNDARYQSETDYNRYMDAYNIAYGQHRDTVSDWQNEMNRADEDYWNQYNRDYGQYSDDRDLSYNNYWNEQNLAYQQERDKLADEQWQKEFEEAQRQFNIANGLNADGSAKSSKSSSSSSSSSSGSGSSGWSTSTIKSVQKWLGVTADGVWGSQSAAAARAKGYNSLSAAVSAMTNAKGNASNSASPVYNGTNSNTGSTEEKKDFAWVGNQVNSYIASGASKSEVNNFIRDAYQAGIVTTDQYKDLKNNLAPRGYTY